MRIVDLSKTIRYNKDDPWFMRVKIKHKPHRKSRWLLRLLGLPKRLYPQGFQGWADDTIVKMGVHSTTHIDAPWHYSPTTAGKPSRTIDEIPLESCIADGIVIDMKHKADFDPITIEDIQSFLDEHNLEIISGMIVLINTGRSIYNGQRDFHEKGTGMSASATEWLIQKGITIMGIDSWGWDLPLPYMIKKARKTDNTELFWEAHNVGQKYEYWHMEQLMNLDALPYSGFKVAVFPLKIESASAAPARVIALLED